MFVAPMIAELKKVLKHNSETNEIFLSLLEHPLQTKMLYILLFDFKLSFNL